MNHHDHHPLDVTSVDSGHSDDIEVDDAMHQDPKDMSDDAGLLIVSSSDEDDDDTVSTDDG
jgi:hypothetical protein